MKFVQVAKQAIIIKSLEKPRESFKTCSQMEKSSTNMSHTVLFVHPKENPETRTYSEYQTIEDCLEAVCNIYEEHLKRKSPDMPTITYEIQQLFDFIDSFEDMCCLVYQKSTDSYAPYCREWIKDKIYDMFREAVIQD